MADKLVFDDSDIPTVLLDLVSEQSLIQDFAHELGEMIEEFINDHKVIKTFIRVKVKNGRGWYWSTESMSREDTDRRIRIIISELRRSRGR